MCFPLLLECANQISAKFWEVINEHCGLFVILAILLLDLTQTWAPKCLTDLSERFKLYNDFSQCFGSGAFGCGPTHCLKDAFQTLIEAAKSGKLLEAPSKKTEVQEVDAKHAEVESSCQVGQTLLQAARDGRLASASKEMHEADATSMEPKVSPTGPPEALFELSLEELLARCRVAGISDLELKRMLIEKLKEEKAQGDNETRAKHLEEHQAQLEAQRHEVETCRARGEEGQKLEALKEREEELQRHREQLQQQKLEDEALRKAQAETFQLLDQELQDRAHNISCSEQALVSERHQILRSREQLAMVQAHVVSLLGKDKHGEPGKPVSHVLADDEEEANMDEEDDVWDLDWSAVASLQTQEVTEL